MYASVHIYIFKYIYYMCVCMSGLHTFKAPSLSLSPFSPFPTHFPTQHHTMKISIAFAGSALVSVVQSQSPDCIDATGEFKLSGKLRTCDWVKLSKEKRCNKWGGKGGGFCPVSCDLCLPDEGPLPPPSGPPSGQAKHVIMIGVDGLRADMIERTNTPNLDRLILEGSYSLNGRVPVQTVSGSGWGAFFCAMRPTTNGIEDNGEPPPPFLFPHESSSALSSPFPLDVPFSHTNPPFFGCFMTSLCSRADWTPLWDPAFQGEQDCLVDTYFNGATPSNGYFYRGSISTTVSGVDFHSTLASSTPPLQKDKCFQQCCSILSQLCEVIVCVFSVRHRMSVLGRPVSK
jgi:hypothetical protein